MIIILLLVVLAVLIKLYRDIRIIRYKVRAGGGMPSKYRELINTLSSHLHHPVIMGQSWRSITFGIDNEKGGMVFKIVQRTSGITVSCNVKGEKAMQQILVWKLDEKLDNTTIAQIIACDTTISPRVFTHIYTSLDRF